MATGKELNGNLYAGKPLARFDDREVALAATPTHGPLLYKTKLAIICVMSAMAAVGATQRSSAQKTSLSESELRTLANAAPDVKTGGKLYSVAMASANDVDRQQAYLKAAAACLIACGKNDVYKKHVKGKLLNAAEVEEELKNDCQQCSGLGTKARSCNECRGNGQCSKCKGSGKTVSVGFDGHNTMKTCSKCKGNGRCPRCDGECSKKEKCMICMGAGKTLNKTVAACVFHDLCNAIADCMSSDTNSNITKKTVPQIENTKKTFKMSASGEEKTSEAKKKKEAIFAKGYTAKGDVASGSFTHEDFDHGNFYYEFNTRGEIYVRGLRVSSQGDSYTIPKKVKYNSRYYDVVGICYNAFTWRNHLKHLRMGDSIRNIDRGAFSECSALEDITIPNSVTNIEDEAFYKCFNLTSVTIGKSVPRLGEYVFAFCESLTNITIPDSVTQIGNGAFSDCLSLTNISIPDSVESIGYGAFCRCIHLESIVLPKTLTKIESSLFKGCKSLTSITIPDGVTSIGDSAFSDCTNLITVTIPNSVRKIGCNAFSECVNLTNITIPSSVKKIDFKAFSGCDRLQTQIPKDLLVDTTLPTMQESIKCSDCNGIGDIYKECPMCKGKGIYRGHACTKCGRFEGVLPERCKKCNGLGKIYINEDD